MKRDEELRARLLQMAERDQTTRARLAADGSLFDGYNPEMQAVHEENAHALRQIIEAQGWPGRAMAGEDGSEAGWLIAQHAIGLPDFQRLCLRHVTWAVAAGDAPAWQVAYLTDRIRVFEGRPQIYGTSFDWDEAGEMSPRPIADPDGVEARRAAVGLPPLAERVAQMRAECSNQPKPPNFRKRRMEMDAWARKVGWR